MAISSADKAATMADYRVHERDVGSPQVQVALITARINDLTRHFGAHRKDNHSRRGLIGLVNRRRRLLAYLKSRQPMAYRALIKRLNLRK